VHEVREVWLLFVELIRCFVPGGFCVVVIVEEAGEGVYLLGLRFHRGGAQKDLAGEGVQTQGFSRRHRVGQVQVFCRCCCCHWFPLCLLLADAFRLLAELVGHASPLRFFIGLDVVSTGALLHVGIRLPGHGVAFEHSYSA
jgi:hypothetical protein